MVKKVKSKKEIEELKKQKIIDSEQKQKRKKMEKDVIIILIIMAVAFLAFFVFLKIFTSYAVSFNYEGLKFKKEAYGKLIFYHTQVNLVRPDGRFQYNLYLRNDPRKLEQIPADFSLIFMKDTIATFDPVIDRCSDAGLAGLGIGDFFSAMGSKVKGATTDEQIANETGKPFVTCENTLNATVIKLVQGDNSSIAQDNENGNCYILNIKNCEVMETTERFLLASLVQMIGGPFE